MTAFIKAPNESHINEFGYNPNTMILTIKFKFGTYDYKSVPKSVYEALINAKSKGTFINANIKGKYSFNKV